VEKAGVTVAEDGTKAHLSDPTLSKELVEKAGVIVVEDDTKAYLLGPTLSSESVEKSGVIVAEVDTKACLSDPTLSNESVEKAGVIVTEDDTKACLSDPTLSSEPVEKAGATVVEEDITSHLSNNSGSQLATSMISTWKLPSNVANLSDYEIVQGQMLSESVKANSTSSFYTAGPLEVRFEYLMGPDLTTPDRRPKELPFSIEWLTAEEAENLRDHRADSIIDADLLEAESLHALDGLNCLYIAARKSVLRITLHHQEISHLAEN
jgi:hypothetical protein